MSGLTEASDSLKHDELKFSDLFVVNPPPSKQEDPVTIVENEANDSKQEDPDTIVENEANTVPPLKAIGYAVRSPSASAYARAIVGVVAFPSPCAFGYSVVLPHSYSSSSNPSACTIWVPSRAFLSDTTGNKSKW